MFQIQNRFVNAGKLLPTFLCRFKNGRWLRWKRKVFGPNAFVCNAKIVNERLSPGYVPAIFY
jgi:hypothetical protein